MKYWATEVYPSLGPLVSHPHRRWAGSPHRNLGRGGELHGILIDADGDAHVRLFPRHREERARLDRAGVAALEAARLEGPYFQDLDVCHATSVSTRTDIPATPRRGGA